MRSVQRNKQTIWYALRLDSTEVIDEYGNATGEFVEQYSIPMKLNINIGVPKGQINLERFGLNDDYTRVLATTDMDCPIAVDTILWVGIEPTLPHNFVVKKIMPAINQLLIAIQEVNGEHSAQIVSA